MTTAERSTARANAGGIWIFVFLDMAVFALLFANYLAERAASLEIFAATQATLAVALGFINTLVLLSSSWAMAEALARARASNWRAARRWLEASFAGGGVFVAIKIVEYSDKISHGVSVSTNAFYAFYFVITGLHFLHVIGGMVFIALCRIQSGRARPAASPIALIEKTGLFWHFVDVLWVIIFPLLYLASLR